jgi:hypothetical protein
MERHDPLGQVFPAPTEPLMPAHPPKPKRVRKAPPLLRALADVSDDSLAFLYGGPDQEPGDYERNQVRAGEIRRDFTAFCEANPHFANWRQAWSAFMAERSLERSPPEPFRPAVPQPATLKPPQAVQTPVPALPRWRQRMQAVAAICG